MNPTSSKQILYVYKSSAVKASVSMALLLSLPLMLVLFITTIMLFKVPDDVVGPLGAMLLILLFTAALTCTLVFSSELKRFPISADYFLSEEKKELSARRINLACAITALATFAVSILISLFVNKIDGSVPIILTLSAFIVAFAIVVFSIRYKCVMKLKRTKVKTQNKRTPVPVNICGLVGWAIYFLSSLYRFIYLNDDSAMPESLYELLWRLTYFTPSLAGLLLVGTGLYLTFRKKKSEKHETED